MVSTHALQWTFLIASVLQLNQASSEADNRDSTCADASFGPCTEFGAEDATHTENLEGCIAQCELLAIYGNCDFLLFYTSGPYENCHLLYGEVVLEDYLETCDAFGGPLFN